MKKIVLLLFLVAFSFGRKYTSFDDLDNPIKGDTYYIVSANPIVVGKDYIITQDFFAIISSTKPKIITYNNGELNPIYPQWLISNPKQMVFFNVKKFHVTNPVGFTPINQPYFVDLVYEGVQLHEVEMKSGEVKKFKMQTFTAQLVTDNVPEELQKEIDLIKSQKSN